MKTPLTRARETEPGWRVIETAVAAARSRLDRELTSAYAIGSLAHGGFNPAVSDVDLALLTSGTGANDMTQVVAAIGSHVRAEVPGDLAERLSVFHVAWRDFRFPPSRSRFPAIDRQDLVRSGVLVHGEDLRGKCATLPTDTEVIEQAVSSALRRHTPESLTAELNELLTDAIEVRAASKLVLWPIRLLHAAQTATATSNAAAVEHYRATPGAAHVRLAQLALRWRSTGAITDPLGARDRLTAELFPLHHEIFDRLSHDPRVPRADELAERAARFTTSEGLASGPDHG